MLDILAIVAPIFLVVGAGYAAARLGLIGAAIADELMTFVMRFAVTALLFRATATIALGSVLDPALMAVYYLPAFACFGAGLLAARRAFGHTPGESVAAGFNTLFANTLFLGLPIIQRAYGEAAAPAVFAVIAIHAPVMYGLGIIAMESAARDGGGARAALRKIARALSRNPLVIAVGLGFAFNASGLPLPAPVDEALALLAGAALPTAMFAIGAALTRYRIAGALAETLWLATLKLAVHPALAFAAGAALFGADAIETRTLTLLAAMPGGMNIYVFATLYGRLTGLAASALLLGTALSALTIPVWLAILG